MRKRFIVGIDVSTVEQDKLFINYLKENGYGYWHWVSNFWLIVSFDTVINAETLRDKIQSFYPTGAKIVIESHTPAFNWAGFGPSGEHGENFSAWLNDEWLK